MMRKRLTLIYALLAFLLLCKLLWDGGGWSVLLVICVGAFTLLEMGSDELPL